MARLIRSFVALLACRLLRKWRTGLKQAVCVSKLQLQPRIAWTSAWLFDASGSSPRYQLAASILVRNCHFCDMQLTDTISHHATIANKRYQPRNELGILGQLSSAWFIRLAHHVPECEAIA